MTSQEVRELFERALYARKDLDHLRARLERLQTPPLSSGIPQVVSGSVSDPTGNAASTLADEEADFREIEAARIAEIDRARRLIRGVRKGLGLVYADVLEDYYIRAQPWDTVARINGVGKTTVLRYRGIAFDWIASLGLARAESGEAGAILGAAG